MVHCGMHGEEALERVTNADRKLEENQAEIIAERRGGTGIAQVDGHCGADRDAVGILAMLAQVAAERTRRGRHQKVVDRAAEHFRDGLHFGKR